MPKLPDLYAIEAPVYDRIYIDGAARASDDVDFYRDICKEHVREKGVLEFGCGTGRVGMGIIEAGLAYTGVDLSPGMLAEFREKLQQADLSAPPLHVGSMTDFEAKQQFDCIISPFRVIAHLIEVEDQLRFLENAKKHLAPGGRFIFDHFHPNLRLLAERAAYPLREERDVDIELPDGGQFRRYTAVTIDLHLQQFIFNERLVTISPDGAIDEQTVSFGQRYYFRYEIQHLLARVGFCIVNLWGDFDRSPFDAKSPEIIIEAALSGC